MARRRRSQGRPRDAGRLDGHLGGPLEVNFLFSKPQEDDPEAAADRLVTENLQVESASPLGTLLPQIREFSLEKSQNRASKQKSFEVWVIPNLRLNL